jgi:CheY-like chemotaxis protein
MGISNTSRGQVDKALVTSSAAPTLSEIEMEQPGSETAGPREPGQRERPTRPDVLVVEDDPDIREALASALELEGYRVAAAENGLRALEVMERLGPPHVVVLDLMMPVMSGLELLERLRADEHLARLPVIVVSAWERHPAELAGAQAFMRKPVDLDELLALVAHHGPNP